MCKNRTNEHDKKSENYSRSGPPIIYTMLIMKELIVRKERQDIILQKYYRVKPIDVSIILSL